MTRVDIGRDRTITPPPLPIAVNGREIPRTAITREAQYHPASSAAGSWGAAASALVVRELLLQEVARKGVDATPTTDEAGRRETAETASIRELIEREVAVPEPGPDELRRYYDANRARFRSPDLYEPRHILVAARADDAGAYAAARTRAQAIAEEVARAPDRFDALARAHSDCASANEGGWLGQLTADEVTREFAAALVDLGEGETTLAPVATRYGFHVIRLQRRIRGEVMPFDAAAPRIAAYLTERSRNTAIAQYIARLVSAADISGIEMANAETHRVSPQ